MGEGFHAAKSSLVVTPIDRLSPREDDLNANATESFQELPIGGQSRENVEHSGNGIRAGHTQPHWRLRHLPTISRDEVNGPGTTMGFDDFHGGIGANGSLSIEKSEVPTVGFLDSNGHVVQHGHHVRRWWNKRCAQLLELVHRNHRASGDNQRHLGLFSRRNSGGASLQKKMDWLNLFTIRAGLKVIGVGSLGSVFPLTLFLQAPPVESGLSPHLVSLIAAILGPITSVALAVLTMRRLVKKDLLENEQKRRQLDHDAEAAMHSSLAGITSVTSDERKDARAAMLELIEFYRTERDRTQSFYSAQLKDKQSTIELQKSLLVDVESFKLVIGRMESLLGKIELLIVRLLPPMDPQQKGPNGG